MGASNSTSVSVYPKNNYLVKNTNGNKEQTPIIELSEIELEHDEIIKIKNGEPKTIDYCILDNEINGIEECLGLFKSDNSYIPNFDQYRITKSSDICYSYIYRPGLIFKNQNEAQSLFENNVMKGKKCQIVFQDYNYNDRDLERCCFTNNKENCNANLINNYTTKHCNIIMKKKCKKDPENDNCIIWLDNTNKRLDNEALELYSNYCSVNHKSLACDYLCKEARGRINQNSKYCDIALENYCKNNIYETNCHCVITPSDKIPEVEKYLGPKECWLSSCSSQTNSKWLTTEQLNTRSLCQLTYCVITIDSLTLNDNATAELINDCVSGPKISAAKANNIEILKKTKNIEKNTLFSVEYFLITSIMVVLLLSFN